MLMDAALQFNSKSKYVRVEVFSIGGISQSFSSSLRDDLALVQSATTLV